MNISSPHLRVGISSLGLLFSVLCLEGCVALVPGSQNPLTDASPTSAQPIPTELAWTRPLHHQGMMNGPGREGSRPAVSTKSELVWTGTSHSELHCLDLNTGKTVWTADIGGVRSGVKLFKGLVYAGGGNGKLSALDAYTGTIKWTYDPKGVISVRPVIKGDHVYIVDGTNTIYALNHRSGELIWQRARSTPRQFSVRGEAPPYVRDGHVYTGFSDGYLVAYRADDGAIVWTKNLAPKATKFPDIDAEIAHFQGVIYAASIGGGLYALDPKTGKTLWSLPSLGIVSLKAFEGDLIVGTDRQTVMRIDTYRQRKRWTAQMADGIGAPTRASIIGPYAVFATTKGPLYWVEAATGRPVRQFNPGPGFQAPVATTKRAVIALDNSGRVYAFLTDRPRRDQRSSPLID